MKIRRYFLIMFVGTSVLICGTSAVSLVLFETQLDRVSRRTGESLSQTMHTSITNGTKPLIEKLSSKLRNKSEAEQIPIISSLISAHIRQIPSDAFVAVIQLPRKNILYTNTAAERGLIDLMAEAALLPHAPPLGFGNSPWFIHIEKIPGTELWYGEALNVESLEKMFSPLLMFHRYIGFGIIGTTLFLIITSLIMTWSIMKKAGLLEKENEEKASELAQTNLLLNIEVNIRKKIEQELKNANSELRHLSSTDQLTGIANRRMFDTTIEKEWARHQRDRQPLTLLICDVDYFKRYNDTYGHQKGDDTLKKVAAVLQESCRRPADLAARYGGEEFCIILPETDAEGAKALAENIQKMLEDENIEHRKSSVADHLTLSIGTATMIPSATDSCEKLLKDADRALYSAKEHGRNRIEQK